MAQSMPVPTNEQENASLYLGERESLEVLKMITLPKIVSYLSELLNSDIQVIVNSS